MKFPIATVSAIAVAFNSITVHATRRRAGKVTCHQVRRMLTSSVNVNDGGGAITVPRDDVVYAVRDALMGGEFFIAVEHSSDTENVQLLKLTSDGASVPQDTSGAFEVVGNFVVNEPDVTYTVNCPEYSAGAMCSVEETQDCGLIYTADGIGNDADLKEECADVTYKIGLKLVNTANGLPHFSLLASRGSDLDINEGCPAMIIFEGSGGKKEMIATKTFSIGHDENIHFFGDTTLKALLEAESKVDAIPWDDHNFLDNTCAHYAGLGLKSPMRLLSLLVVT